MVGALCLLRKARRGGAKNFEWGDKTLKALRDVVCGLCCRVESAESHFVKIRKLGHWRRRHSQGL